MNLEPFPHLVVDDLWPADLLDLVVDEIPHPEWGRWKRYDNEQERKLEGPPNLWGEHTRQLFDRFADSAQRIGEWFGFDDLTMETAGGGYHVIPPGGFLDVHTDFNVSPDTGRYRVINLLVYLNRGWQETDGGELELWDDDGPVVKVLPEFNRTVMFATSQKSWHGHPNPTHRWRLSVAAYFFSAQQPDGWSGEQSTVFHAHRSV